MTLIPSHYLDAVAVLEDGNETRQEFSPTATATLLGYVDPDQSGVQEGSTRFDVFLATNRHVIEGRDRLWIRFNQGSGSKRFLLEVKEQDGSDVFVASSEFDVAVSSLDTDSLKAAGAVFSVLPDQAFLDLAGIESLRVAGGDDVFVLGFPMGLAGTERNYAVVRGGVVARVDREIINESKGFLVDCAVYPGNSGGPVILKPEPVSLVDQEPRSKVHVIGIVSGYLPYTDTAVSQQTGHPRITFQENSGLANVVPFDAINPLIAELKERTAQPAGTETVPDEEGDSPGEN